MKGKTSFFLMIFLFFYLSTSAPPPKPKPKPPEAKEVVFYPIFLQNDKVNSSFKRLDSTEAKLVHKNSTLIVNFYEYYSTSEIEFVLDTINLPGKSFYPNWYFYISSSGVNIDDIYNYCETLNKDDENSVASECISSALLTEDNWIMLLYNFTLNSTNIVKIKIKYNKTNVGEEILYRRERVSIPIRKEFSFCNYTYILSDIYLSLGLEKNLLTKKSDNIYVYQGSCPTESDYDIIKFSPKVGYWKADYERSLYYPQKFTNNVFFFFSRYYRGGKLNNTFYKLYSPVNQTKYNDSNIIYNGYELNVTVPAKNMENISVKLETGFINDLRDEFKVYLNESYYQINITAIPQVIKDKVSEIIFNNTDDVPNYYSLGKFVNSYMTYDLDYAGKRYTLEEIFNNKRGVCEHYTLLYNAMLNTLGINTFYVSGWALQGNETSGNTNTTLHAWTVALIDGKWKELDATWGLFEGIPAGHIFKNFNNDYPFYILYDHGETKSSFTRNIKLYYNINDIYDYSEEESTIITNEPSTLPLEESTSDYLEISTNKLLKDSTNVVSEESKNIQTNESTIALLEETTNTLLEESTYINIKKSTNTLLEKSTNNQSEESTNIFYKESTNIQSGEESSFINMKKSTNFLSKETTNILQEETTNSQKEESTNIHAERSIYVPLKEPTNIILEQSTFNKYEESTIIENKESINSQIEESTNIRPEESTNIEYNDSTNIQSEKSTSRLSKGSTNTLSEESTDNNIEDSTNIFSKESTNILSEESTNIQMEKSSTIIGTKSSIIQKIESSNIHSEESTNIQIEESTNNQNEQSTNIPTKESTNILSEESSNIQIEETTNIQIKVSTNIETKKSTNILSKDSTNIEFNGSTNIQSEESTNDISKESTNILPEKSTNINVKESTIILSEASTNIQSQKTTDMTSKESTNIQLEESTNIQLEESTNIKQEESTNILITKSSIIQNKESTNIQIKESTNNIYEESTNIQTKESTNIISKESTNIEYNGSTNIQSDKSTIGLSKESTNTLSEESTIINIKDSTNVQAIDSTNILQKESTNIQIEESRNIQAESSINVPLKESTNNKYEESITIETKGSTNIHLEESSNIPSEKSSNIQSKESTNIISEESTNVELKSSTNINLKESTDIVSKKSTNIQIEESTNIRSEGSTDISTKESTTIKPEESTNIQMEESTNNQYKESTNIQTKESTNIQLKETTNSEIEGSSNFKIEESTNELSVKSTNTQREESTKEVSEQSSYVSLDKSSIVQLPKTTEIQTEELTNIQIDSTTIQAKESTNILSEKSTNIHPLESTKDILIKSTNIQSKESTNTLTENSSDLNLKESTSAEYKQSTNTLSEKLSNINSIEASNVPSTEYNIKSTEKSINSQSEELNSEESTTISKEKSTNILSEQINKLSTDEITYNNIETSISQETNIKTEEKTNTPSEDINNIQTDGTIKEATNDITNQKIKDSTNELTKDSSIIEESDSKSEMSNTVINSESNNIKYGTESNIVTNEKTDISNTQTTDSSKEEIISSSSKNNIIETTIPLTTPNMTSSTQSIIPTTIQATNPKASQILVQTTNQVLPQTTIPIIPPIDNINRTNISLSFRQLQNFTQNEIDKTISFDFYTLTTDSQSKIPKNINVKVNLIKINGTREDEITNANCILNNNIINNNYASQAHYICTIKNLNEDYHSFRFNNSEYISGVPDDEYYLDPYMTKKYINENKIDDVLKIGLPTTFIIKSINYDTCNKNGIFTILGDLSQELSQSYIFKIPLKQPDIGIISTCNITNNQIECKVDREINDNIIAIEETIIKENYKEILLLSNAKTKEKITCKNALYEDSTKKKEINISFRQISHLTQITNGLSFYLITLMNKPYKKDYQFNININIFINQIKTKKNAICILENDVSQSDGLIEQGNFKCILNLTNDEYNKADYKTISISSNNDNINGVSDLDEITANPYKTDEFIKEVNNKKSKGEKLNNITDIFDYYSENIKFSPILNIDSINIDDCQNKGKLYLIGKLSVDINQKMIFDLPLTYPNTEIKCELEKVKKDANINITCKTQTKFENIENIIIESRLIKKKNLEQLFINGKEINFEAKKSCENYNTIKVQISKKRQKTKFTFLHLSKFNPIKNGLNFFISLIRNALEYDFYEKFTFTIKILITNKRYLRYLEDSYQPSIPVLCNLNQELKSNYAAGYDCSNTVSISGTPTDMKIETEYLEDISGIPDNNDQEYLKGIIDYTNINNLKAIDNLPIVNITNINGDTCSENGQYIITAKYANNKNNNLKNKYNNVVIRFDSPESSGLCQININDIITMTCENKEKFAVSQILIERNVVQDQEGNDIFIVNSYTNLEVFGCDISYNSIINDNSNEQTEKISYLKYRNTKNGLTGGAIAGIIIACIAVIAAIIIVVVLANKGIIFQDCIKKQAVPKVDQTTTVNNLNYSV